jgi:putative endonuclease
MWRSDGTRKQFYVYIMSNSSMTLYTGMTNDVMRRAGEHKSRNGSTFTARYCVDRLVYFETYDLAIDAIAREKSIKGLTRAKKIALVKAANPTWRDLSLAPS